MKLWHASCSCDNCLFPEEMMVNIDVENFDELVILLCQGSISNSDAAFALRDAVISQTDCRLIVLDFSDVHAIGGGGVGMLLFLQRWAQARDIRLKLFNPSQSLCQRLQNHTAIPAFEFATLDEITAHLHYGVRAAAHRPDYVGETHG